MEGVFSSEERELQSLQEKYKLVVSFSDSLKAQLAKAEEDLQKARHENLQLSLTSEAAKSQNDTLQHENKALASAKVELVQLLEREKDKVARLKETVNNIESFNLQGKTSTLNCSTLNDIKLKEIELGFKEKRFISERNFYIEQTKQMSEELESKNAELLELRKKLNISTMQANLKLEQQSAEINSCHLENNRLKAIVETNQTAHAELLKKHTELQANCASLESNFSKEINAQTEVINMLMKETEDLKSKLSASNDELEVLRDVSKKGLEANIELEAKFEEMKNSYYKDVAELEAEREGPMADLSVDYTQHICELQNEVKRYEIERNNLSTRIKHLTDASDGYTRQIHALQREVKRYEVECNNFSIQIQHLMKSLAEAQEGYSINTSSVQLEQHGLSSGPIPANMLTFRDIQSLQEQNRNLMRYIHSLMDGDESSPNNSEKMTSLVTELDNYKQEVERLQNELAERSRADDSFQRSGGDSTVDAENKTLRAKVDKYQQDIEVCRQQHLEQVRRLDADKNNLISENVTFKSQLAKLAGDLEAKALLLENTNITMEKLEQENNSLRERNIKLNSTIEHLEKSIIYLKSELEAAKQTLKDVESKAAVSRSERDVLKNAELSLTQENAHIREELENQKRIVYQLQAIQANNQESERESIRCLQMQCENLKANTEFYQKKAASDEEKWASSIATFSSQINNLQTMLEKEKNGNVEWQRKYFELQQQLNQQLEKGAVFAQQAVNSDSSNHIPSADQKRQIAHLQDEIKVLKGKLANSETSCESLKAFNSSLEENLAQLVKHNDETRINIETELQNKADEIRKLKQEIEAARQIHESIVGEKNAKIEQALAAASENESIIEELKQLLAEAKVETRKAQENEQSLQDDLTYQKVIAAKLQEDYEAEAALRSTDASTIIGLKLELETLQKTAREKETEIEKLNNQVTQNIQSWENRIKELNLQNEKLQIEHSELKSVNEVLLNQTEQLNNQLIALQSNSSLFAQDESTQKENASQMAGVVKFYRDENAHLQSKLSELNDEHSRLKIEMDNCLKEIESLKSSLEAERQSTLRLSNTNEYRELFAKAELVPVLTENTSQMRIELSKLEQRNRELIEKVARLETNAKEVSELSNKAEGEVVEKQFLRNEIEQWKAKANSLTQQLKNFDSESMKRIMAEKTQLSKSIQSLTLEKEKLVASLEQANKQIQEEANEKTHFQTQAAKLQKINTQLRNLALKYKNAVTSVASSTAPSFVSSDTVVTSAATLSGSSSQSSLPTTVSSVTPQTTILPLATKTTPTASIKPLIDANATKTVSRGINRPVTVVQPTANAEESTSVAMMNQTANMATVQPTQPQAPATATSAATSSAASATTSSATTSATTTAASSTATSTASTASVSSTCVPSSVEVAETPTESENPNGDSISSAPSTSTGFTGYSATTAEESSSKRTLDDASDEPSTSSNLKKFKSTEEEDYDDEEYDSDEQGEEEEDEENDSREEEVDGEGGYEGRFHEGDEEREAEGEKEDEEEEEDEEENEQDGDDLEDEYDESSESEEESDSDIEIIEINDDDDEQPQQQVSGNNAPPEEVSSSFVSRPDPIHSVRSDDDDDEEDADANESND